MRATIIRALLAVAIVACACAHQLKNFQSRGVQIAYETSYRVIVICDTVLTGFGSAVAIGPSTLVTAKHVADAACPSGSAKLVAVSAAGAFVIVQVGRRHPTADLATLETSEPTFKTWAPIGTHDSVLGAPLNAHVGSRFLPGDIPWSFVYKRLYADGYVLQDGIRVLHLSGSVTPGNSGGGILNEAGELIAVIVARDAGPDLRGVAITADVVRELLKNGPAP